MLFSRRIQSVCLFAQATVYFELFLFPVKLLRIKRNTSGIWFCFEKYCYGNFEQNIFNIQEDACSFKLVRKSGIYFVNILFVDHFQIQYCTLWNPYVEPIASGISEPVRLGGLRLVLQLFMGCADHVHHMSLLPVASYSEKKQYVSVQKNHSRGVKYHQGYRVQYLYA